MATTTPPTTATTPTSSSSSAESHFQKEIRCTMTRSGDRITACPSSALFLEQALRTDLANLAELVVRSATTRKSVEVCTDDFAFQLRRNKPKLHRLTCFLRKRQLLLNRRTMIDDVEFGVDPSLTVDINHKPWKRRKATNTRYFPILENSTSSDTPNLLFLNSYDSLSWQRIVRSDHISEGLSVEEYELYANRVQFSFLKEPSPVFPYFSSLLPPSFRIQEACAPIVAYLAHEFVQQMVEDAMAVYRDVVSRVTSRVTSREGSDHVICVSCKKSKEFTECLNPFYYEEVLRRFRTRRGRIFSLYIL